MLAGAASGSTVHVICRVRDNACGARETYMVGYARVILTVR